MARYFDGNAADYLSVNSNNLNLDGALSLLLFARVLILNRTVGYIAGVGVTYQIEWNQPGDDTFRFGFEDSNNAFQEGTSYKLGVSGWHSVCYIMNGVDSLFFIDGKFAGRGPIGTGIRNVAGFTDFSIGYDLHDALRPFTGGIADVIVMQGSKFPASYASVLHNGQSPYELAGSGTSANIPQLRGWYPLKGAGLKDASGRSGPDLTVNGRVTIIPDPPPSYRESITFLKLASPLANTDSGTGLLTFTVSGTETPGLGSLGTEVLALTPITTYEGLNSEFGTDDFKLTPSGSDVQDIHDTNSEYFDLQPSGAEAAQYPLVEATTEYFDLQPSGVDVLGKQYLDSGTVLVDLQVETHECYVHGTPEYEIDLFKKWLMQINKQWEVTNLQKRWSVSVLPGALEIPC